MPRSSRPGGCAKRSRPAATLTERQLASLVERQRRLTNAVGRLATAVASVRTAGAVADVPWERSPADPETELPGRTAFEENLLRLTAAAIDRPRGGLLLVSLDRFDKLAERIGAAAAGEVRRTVARLLCRAGRDADLACAVDAGTFAVLLTDAEPGTAEAQAAALRDAFRAHPFRLGPDGPEVFLTASFGYAPCLPGDHARLLVDRAEVAVAQSRRQGRNRLHRFEAASGRFLCVEAAERRAAAPTNELHLKRQSSP